MSTVSIGVCMLWAGIIMVRFTMSLVDLLLLIVQLWVCVSCTLPSNCGIAW